MGNLNELLESGLLLWGLALGTVCLLTVTALTWNRKGQRPLPIGGTLIAVATMIGASLGGEFSAMAWIGIATMLVLTVGAEMMRFSRSAVALVAIPGAMLMAVAAPADPSWLRFVTFAAIPIAGFLCDEFESRYEGMGLGMLFFGLACAGTFLAVPDTELVRTLMAAAFPIMFLAWPRVRVSLGRSGSYMAVAMFILSTTTGGVGREASVIGAMACLGFLVIEPVVVRARPALARLPDYLHNTPEAVVLASLPQIVLVLVASRVAGPLESYGAAILIVAVLYAFAVLALVSVEQTRLHDLTDQPWRG